MTPTTYQAPEIRDSNDNVIKQGSFGKNTALANSTNDGWIDYVANDLEFLYGLAKDEVVPVSELPSTGDTNKTYLLTTTGVCYRWDGTEWVAVSSSEAVGRAETAASLAEQWATKTSGTVDGTEYSAKYYAEQAQDTADDLSESLEQIATNTANIEENIATNTETIAQHTTDIDIAEKRIGNIEKLLQGNLYDYQTESTSAYTKTVPQGAMPYASLDSMGGKTLVWNQLVAIPSTDISKTENGITFTDNRDGSYTVSGTATADTTLLLDNLVELKTANKYIISGCPSGGGATTYSCGLGTNANTTDVGGGKWYDRGSAGNNSVTARITVYSGTVISTPIKFYPQVHNLTLMYGSGNEPTTVAEFQQMFPANYYAFTQGTLLSAGVTEVVSKGKNLADFSGGAGVPSNTASSSVTKRTFPVGKYIKGLTYTNYYYSAHVDTVTTTADSISFISHNSIYGIGIPFNCKPSTNYSVSVGTVTNGKVALCWYGKDGSYLSYSYGTVPPYTQTSPAYAKQGLVVLYANTINTTSTFDKIQIEESATATPYSPAGVIATYPIPAEIQALEGYGWSAGTVYNYIDYERKVFVQNVGRVDLGTLSWVYYAYSGHSGGYSSGIKDYAKKPTTSSEVTNILTTVATTVSDDRFNVNNNGTNICFNQVGNIKITIPNVTDSASLKSALDGVYLYYELATPIETDISAYITDDNLIEVEAGGTLTFPNSNGTDYQIPVPSAETYMVDLQEAI